MSTTTDFQSPIIPAFYTDPLVGKDFLRTYRCQTHTPDLPTLGNILKAFTHFPYENLTKIVKGFDADLDSDACLRLPHEVLNDHIRYRSGGTCYSLTYFFKSILDYCGYISYPVLADRSYGENTHCALVVHVEGKRFLADPGYCLEHPLMMPDKSCMTEQPFPHATMSLVRDGHYARRVGCPVVNLVTDQGGKKQVRYHLKDDPIDEVTFKHWWRQSFSWPMMRQFCMTRNTDEGYIYVRKNHIRHQTKGKRHVMRVDHDFEAVVAREFDVDIRIVREARECLREKRERFIRERNS